MSQKKIKRKKPKAKDMKELRKRIQKAIVEVNEDLSDDQQVTKDDESSSDDSVEDFKDVT